MGSRRLRAPAGDGTRPTSDRVREALFSSLGARGVVTGARVLDAFAGTGALGIEALSRGAIRADFIERDAKALQCVRANISDLGLTGVATVHPCAVEAFARRASAEYTLLFADPPYALLREPAFVKTWQMLTSLLLPGGVAVLEHDRRDPSPSAENAQLEACREYGDTTIAIYVRLAP